MLNPDKIKSGIKKNKILNTVILFGSIDSTNKYLMSRDFSNGSIVIAEEQEGGRGKHGAKWVSPKGGLWFSYVINKKEKNPYIYIILSSVAIVEALAKYKVKAKIKWPNDILVNNKKICGMLVENDSYSGRVVTGIGVNVNNAVPKSTEIPAISLGKVIKRKAGVEKLFSEIVSKIDKYLKTGKSALINKWVKNQVDIKGRKIKIIKDKKTISGEVLKVRRDGSVVIKDNKGKKREIKGEVFFL